MKDLRPDYLIFTISSARSPATELGTRAALLKWEARVKRRLEGASFLSMGRAHSHGIDAMLQRYPKVFRRVATETCGQAKFGFPGILSAGKFNITIWAY